MTHDAEENPMSQVNPDPYNPAVPSFEAGPAPETYWVPPPPPPPRAVPTAPLQTKPNTGEQDETTTWTWQTRHATHVRKGRESARKARGEQQANTSYPSNYHHTDNGET